jgi:hypothetical protein
MSSKLYIILFVKKKILIELYKDKKKIVGTNAP